MKTTVSLFLALMVYSHMTSAQELNENGKFIRILTYNILHGATTKGDFNLDIIADVILQADPDLVALQEVDYKTNRALKYDLTTELGYRTKMASIFARAMEYDGGEYGEGILSKYTFIKSRNVALPYTPGNEPRAAIEVITILSSGDTIAFIGTHLDHLRDDKDRVSQAKKINEAFTPSTYPTILAGDLNAIPGSQPINILERLWGSSYDKTNPAPTFPSSNPKVKIDFVMFYPQNKWKVIETKVIENQIASDHCAYLVTLELLDD
jgi:endonuclease/exonuclease/phosphatase family metal-dependent hydrolase